MKVNNNVDLADTLEPPAPTLAATKEDELTPSDLLKIMKPHVPVNLHYEDRNSRFLRAISDKREQRESSKKGKRMNRYLAVPSPNRTLGHIDDPPPQYQMDYNTR
jgi:hypothetical protein